MNNLLNKYTNSSKRLQKILHIWKELSLCHKLWFSNLYIFSTQCCRPYYSNLWIMLDQIIQRFKISKVYTSHRYQNICVCSNNSFPLPSLFWATCFPLFFSNSCMSGTLAYQYQWFLNNIDKFYIIKKYGNINLVKKYQFINFTVL